MAKTRLSQRLRAVKAARAKKAIYRANPELWCQAKGHKPTKGEAYKGHHLCQRCGRFIAEGSHAAA